MTITTDFTGGESRAVDQERFAAIAAYYGVTGIATRGDIRVGLNAFLPVPFADRDMAGDFLPKINDLNKGELHWLNSMGGSVSWYDPSDMASLFQDAAGTVPVTAPGQSVGRISDKGTGGRHATQATAAARPVLGRHPASGLRNRLPNNTTGAVVGVVGSGGALPTGWTVAGVAGVEVLSVADKNGRPNVTVRLTGVPTSTIFVTIGPATAAIAAAIGQTWTGSVWLQMTAGSLTGLTTVHNGVFGFQNTTSLAGNLGADQAATIASDLRRSTTHTMADASTNRVVNYLRLGTTGAAIDITLDISGAQLEQAAAASTLQLTSANGYDVTEAGQADCWYLGPDQVDDWLQLASAFQPAGDFAFFAGLAAVSTANNWIFGSAAGGFRVGLTSGGTIAAHVNFSGNRTEFAPNQLGRQVIGIRSVGAGAADGWRNNVLLTATLTGAMRPVDAGGVDRLLREGTNYAGARLYGCAMVDRAVSNAEAAQVGRVLALKTGVSL